MQSTQPKTIPFTKAAFEKLVAEEKRLGVELEAIKQRVKDAREQGDLSENGAYHYGKFELGSISRQLRSVKHQLSNGYIIRKPTDNTVVQVGHTVTLTANRTLSTYTLVSQYEANPKDGKISIESPIGQAVLGKKVGEAIEVNTPAGQRSYTIKEISAT